MKKLIFSSLLLASFITACNSEKKDLSGDTSKTDTVVATDTSSIPVDTATANKAWAAYMTPGDVHKMMASANGKWNAEMTMYMPDGSSSTHKMICENQMILGGRYQQSVYKGSFEGMPFEGIATLAYDNARKIYISSWIDNMGTGMMYLEGTFDEATKTITSRGKSIDVTTGKEIQIRETMQFMDNDNQLMEMFDTKNGKENKSMSIKLTRAK